MFKGVKDDVESIASGIALADISLKKFVTRLKESVTGVKDIIQAAGLINTKTANAVRDSIGQTRAISNDVQKVIAQAAKSTMQIGVGAEKNIELFAAINTAMLRNTYFTEQQIVRFQALGVNANMTSAQLADMATSFDTLGYTTDEALSTMEDMTKQARSYGVNVSSFMGKVNDNLKLMVTYNFKDGVKGLSKMVAQAQALRIDMSKTVSFADGLLDPSKAIETAAGFQMLGGSVGALGDPFKLLNMAQTDMEGLQDSLVEMAAGAVSFNKESGEFDIPITQMYRLREAATLAGMNYQEFSEMAMNAAQRTEKIKLLDQFQTVPEEQKELIASLGKIGSNGNLEITMPDGTVKKIGQGFNDLINDDYAALQGMLDTNAMSELDVAKKSMGYLNQIKAAQDTIVKLTTLNLVQSGGFENLSENISKSQQLMTDSFMKREDEIKLPPTVTNAVTYLETQLKVTEPQADDITGAVVNGLDKFNVAMESVVTQINNTDFAQIIIESLKTGWENVSGFLSDLDLINIFPDTVNITGNIDRSNDESVPVNGNNIDRSNGVDNGGIDRSNESAPIILNGNNIDGGNGVDDGGIDRSNSTSALQTINSQSSNQSQPTNQSAEVTVNGVVSLTLEGIQTDSTLDAETLARLLTNNPTSMSIIKSQIDNSLNAYGNDWGG